MKYYIEKDIFDEIPIIFGEKELYEYEKKQGLNDIEIFFDEFCKQEKLSRYEIFTCDHKKLEKRYITWYTKHMINGDWREVELNKDTIQSIKNGD